MNLFYFGSCLRQLWMIWKPGLKEPAWLIFLLFGTQLEKRVILNFYPSRAKIEVIHRLAL